MLVLGSGFFTLSWGGGGSEYVCTCSVYDIGMSFSVFKGFTPMLCWLCIRRLLACKDVHPLPLITSCSLSRAWRVLLVNKCWACFPIFFFTELFKSFFCLFWWGPCCWLVSFFIFVELDMVWTVYVTLWICEFATISSYSRLMLCSTVFSRLWESVMSLDILCYLKKKNTATIKWRKGKGDFLCQELGNRDERHFSNQRKIKFGVCI